MDNTINSIVSQATSGVSDAQIRDFLATDPTPQQLASAMQTYGVSPEQVFNAAGVGQGGSLNVGGTIYQPDYATTGSGMDQQVGPLLNIYSYQADQNKVGGAYNQYDPTGQLQRTGTQQEVNATKDFLKFAALAGGGLYGLNALGATEAGLAVGGGGSTLGSLGSLTAGITPEMIAAGEAGLGAGVGGTALGSLTAGLTPAMIAAGEVGLPGANAGLLAGAGSALGAGAGSALGTGVGSALGTGAGSALGTSLATGLGLSALGNVLGTAANQSGISDARNLINQYGTQAQGNLAKAYADAQALNVANRGDLASNYGKTQGNLYDIYNQQVKIQQPYQAVGQAGSQGLIGNQDYFNRQFTNADLNANLAPNYAFQLQQGQMANQRAANMGGGALSGNALQGLQRYTQDYAGNAYQNAFNNFNTQRNNIYNTLSGMANIGTTSGGQLASLGNTLGGNLGSLSSNYGGNITTNAGQGIGAANAYGLNTANLATGIGSALAGNAVAGGANTANALNTLGNTALLGSMLKAT